MGERSGVTHPSPAAPRRALTVALPDALGRTAPRPDGDSVVAAEDLKRWVLEGTIVRHLFRYSEACAAGYRHGRTPRAFALVLLLRALSRGPCYLEDENGDREKITPRLFVGLACRAAAMPWRRRAVLRRTRRRIERLAEAGRSAPRLDSEGTPVYLLTLPSQWRDIPAGGHFAHTTGVLNTIHRFGRPPILITTIPVPMLRPEVESHLVRIDDWDHFEVACMAANQVVIEDARSLLRARRPGFVYQRYAPYSHAGLEVAREFGVPFVMEYNGPEGWMHRHWGAAPLRWEALADRIELVNLHGADLIVVVSRASRDEVVARGIRAEKIVVAPNGVDTERFSPAVDPGAARQRYGLAGKTVIGFIGTFGAWHGVEVLAEAFARLLINVPTRREHLRLFLVGDGLTMPKVRARLAALGALDACVQAGFVSPPEAPAALAACDVLVAPHVQPADGSEFFGSPTKLFEYMAMGKCIIASDLAQIGEVLEHNRTAWLVPPGDPEALAKGLSMLLEDQPLRARLGEAARAKAVAEHTWARHTDKIIARLRSVAV